MSVLRVIGMFVRFLAARPRALHDPSAEPPKLPGPFGALSHLAFGQPAPNQAAEPGAAPTSAVVARGKLRQVLAPLPFKYRVLIAAPIVGITGLAVLLGSMMVYYTIVFPNPLAMRGKERAPVIRILARDGSVIAERGAAHDFMPLDMLPQHVQAAVVATEDRRFFEHYGLDPVGMIRAFFANLRAGRFAQGGSTLTQQLAKNLFLSADRTMARKIEEVALAFWLEMRLSKHDILELYLNRVYFGGGAYGIESASQRYFDKSARELTLAEAALIAGLLKAPSKYSPASSPGAARARSRVVLAKMLEAGMISPADEAKALAERIIFNEPKTGKDDDGMNYVIDFVLERLPPLVGGGHAEVVVETTIDPVLQRTAHQIVNRNLAKQGDALGASQAAVVVLDTDGGIRAMVGGRDYSESQFNRAVKARRQPGSAFKPFVYLAALESGMTPDSVTYDLPLTIGGWSPRNDNGQYVGEISLRRALAQSVNTVAVRLNQDVGRGRTVEVARRLGIKSDLRDDASIALGTSEVSLLEMAGAYGVFGNGGAAIEPHAIRRVRMSSGRVLFARDAPRTTQVVDPLVVGAMNEMLNAALVTGTGRRAALADHPAAGKTGTTQDFRDAWFIGYTSHLTAGVWIGNDNGKPMTRAVGGGLPAEIWRQIMQAAHQGKAPLALPGTIRQLPSATTAENASLPATTAPRVDRMAEDLPWSSEGATKGAPSTALMGSRRSELTPLAPLPTAAHPTERIDEDFIARALDEDGQGEGGAAMPEAAKPVERPRGLMSLGGWW